MPRRTYKMHFSTADRVADGSRVATLCLSALIVPGEKNSEGVLVEGTSVAWREIVAVLGVDWTQAFKIPPEKWEEIFAGAFERAGYDEVTLTPRSRDFGRDVIAIKNGVGCIKIVGSLKRYAPGHIVDYDDVRALGMVLLGERDASKAIIATTSDFPPGLAEDKFIAPLMPTRLETMNGTQLQAWLRSLKT